MKNRIRIKVYAFIAFLVLLLSFAAIYATLLTPDDFRWPLDIRRAGPTLTDYVYFSSTTISSVGYGDIYPKTPRARRWVILQQVLMVILISFLIIGD